MTSLVLRPATSVDAADLERLAALDSAEPLEGNVLVAYAGGDLRAALDVDTDRAVADPFYPSAELVDLLRAATPGRRRSWRRPTRLRRPALA
ncbi:MAG TPA: hypothetical protein VHJ39_17425 [Solirubrobacteraceae bacterium]|jgi:hypothetical protein|nr:hypothetical protein [Solirubrobacteraceae bacterium]